MGKLNIAAAIQQSWYGERPIAALLPLSAVYGVVVAARGWAYRRGWLKSYRVDRPVLIVGNLSVGGSGKTPLTLAVIDRARELGLQPGVVSRGYGGRADRYPLLVDSGTPASQAGDEPLLIACKAKVPVVVDPNRVDAARCLIESCAVSLIIADDGLQHYRLRRDAEIAVVDARRMYGNGRLLPAGPLREPQDRADQVDMVCRHGEGRDFWLVPDCARNIHDGRQRDPASFGRVHALAGIGHPGRFFNMLRELGLEVVEHPVPDHHRYTSADLEFGDSAPVLMTEKDAVKCAGFGHQDAWSVPVRTVLSQDCTEKIDALLKRITNHAKEHA